VNEPQLRSWRRAPQRRCSPVAFGGMSWPTALQGVSRHHISCSRDALDIVHRDAAATGSEVFRRFAAPFNWGDSRGRLRDPRRPGSLIATVIFRSLDSCRRADLRVWRARAEVLSSARCFRHFFTVVDTIECSADAAKLALRTKERDEARRVARCRGALASIESGAAALPVHTLIHRRRWSTTIGRPRYDRPTRGVDAIVTRQHVRTAVPWKRSCRGCAVPDIERVRSQPAPLHHRCRRSVRTVQVPRLAVQTCENSVKYAVSPRRDGGTIAVRAAAPTAACASRCRRWPRLRRDGRAFGPRPGAGAGAAGHDARDSARLCVEAGSGGVRSSSTCRVPRRESR